MIADNTMPRETRDRHGQGGPKIMNPSIAAGALMLGVLLMPVAASAETPTADELRSAFTGHVRHWTNARGAPTKATYNADGTVVAEVETQRGGIQHYKGTWRIQGNDLMCVAFPPGPMGGGENCTRFEKEGANVYALDAQGKRTTGIAVPIRK
jgi:hypothetical protein